MTISATKEAITKLIRNGMSYSEIAEQLGLTERQMRYQVSKHGLAELYHEIGGSIGRPRTGVRKMELDEEELRRLRKSGMTILEIAKHIGVSYNVVRDRLEVYQIFTGRAPVIRYCPHCEDEITGDRECCSRECLRAWQHHKKVQAWLCGYVTYNEPYEWMKLFLIEIHGECCVQCGFDERHPISGRVPLHMDHINGHVWDNQIANLRLLCLNHHALTLTYKGHNKKLLAAYWEELSGS